MWKKALKRWRRPPTLSSQQAYALWAAAYPARAHNALMQAEESAMRDLMPSLAGLRVLDLACGSGRYARVAVEAGATTCTGVDNSAAMLETGRTENSGSIHYIQGDTRQIPLRAACMDAVLCGLALGHVPHLDEALREIARVLVPGGAALISDFHPFLFLDGKQRTFSAPDGEVYAVEHYAHLYSDYHRAAQRHGLTITHVSEPHLTIDGRELPAVIAYRMQRE